MATNTHSQHVTLIAFPLQKRLHERTSLLRHTYTGCTVDLHACFFLSSLRPAILAKLLRSVHPTLPLLSHSTHLHFLAHFSCFYVTKPSQLLFFLTYKQSTVRGSKSGGGRFSAPVQTGPSPPSLLYNGYRVFPGGKGAGAWR
jgi:hypothetical protein